jgi:hypothetical protein
MIGFRTRPLRRFAAGDGSHGHRVSGILIMAFHTANTNRDAHCWQLRSTLSGGKLDIQVWRRVDGFFKPSVLSMSSGGLSLVSLERSGEYRLPRGDLNGVALGMLAELDVVIVPPPLTAQVIVPIQRNG